ncbi:hypothetical protein ACXITX_11215 [Vibrio parahaemolyticus]|uniref:hypothetical protein n=1 Tax=Vibrio harveyi group TaxID=717610 RepID=UPI0004725F6B|nr:MULTISPECIES: hypothetical protein [Vibrio harveyi group]
MEVVISLVISVALVFIETIGIVIAKWSIARKQADEAAINAMATAAKEYQGNDGMQNHLRDAAKKAKLEVQRKLVTDVSPGPELSFLSLTMFTALFVSYHYSDDAMRASITPYLHGNSNDYPILMAAIFLSLTSWWLLYWWRELILSETQTKMKHRSMVLIAALGTANLTGALFIFIAGRG